MRYQMSVATKLAIAEKTLKSKQAKLKACKTNCKKQQQDVLKATREKSKLEHKMARENKTIVGSKKFNKQVAKGKKGLEKAATKIQANFRGKLGRIGAKFQKKIDNCKTDADCLARVNIEIKNSSKKRWKKFHPVYGYLRY